MMSRNFFMIFSPLFFKFYSRGDLNLLKLQKQRLYIFECLMNDVNACMEF